MNALPDSAYLRLVSVKWPLPFEYPAGHAVEVGKGWVAREGEDAVVFAYGPWLLSNAFAAAEENGRTSDLEHELVALFETQNESPEDAATSIPATFLRVTVSL